jgi:hypothetical protein
MKRGWLLALIVCFGPTACNDLTEPLPPIDGSYEYTTTGGVASLNRRGTVTIVDVDPLSARFEGTFEYRTRGGQTASGQFIGAFIERDRIWFRFLDEKLLVHEGVLSAGRGSGNVFFLGPTYENTGATFSLRRK